MGEEISRDVSDSINMAEKTDQSGSGKQFSNDDANDKVLSLGTFGFQISGFGFVGPQMAGGPVLEFRPKVGFSFCTDPWRCWSSALHFRESAPRTRRWVFRWRPGFFRSRAAHPAKAHRKDFGNGAGNL